MSNLNENLDKAKSFVEDTAKKAKESEAYNKVKDTANEVTQKIKDNEKVAGAIDKINQNEYVKKVNKSKYAIFIKIGAVIVALVVAYNAFFFIFGDKKAKKAQETLEAEFVSLIDDGGGQKESIESKTIAKNEEAYLYLVDATVKYKVDGQSHTESGFYIVYCDDENSFTVKQYKYDKESKNTMKEFALAKLAQG